MKIHRTYQGLPEEDRNAAVAMGNFDGVHLGHQSVLSVARAAAAEKDCPFGVVTFEPHPRSFFAPDAPPIRLMNAEARAHRLAKLGVEQLYELPFDQSLAELSAEEFVGKVLNDGLGVRHVVIGADFKFGKGRAGNAALLSDLGQRFNFAVTPVPLVSDEKGDFSSSKIRLALSEGKPEDAARILGHWHRIEGRVEEGDRRGRDLGFPTANLSLAGLHRPRHGIYAVLVDILEGPHAGSYRGCASIGVRPTFGENSPNLEVHILDFDADIYGTDISVALVAFQRPELKFDNVADLVARMREDVLESRAILAGIDR